jgi:hypothetical protein
MSVIFLDRLLHAAARRPLSDADAQRRGFHLRVPEHRQQMEAIGRAFLSGYNASLLHRDPQALRSELREHPRPLRPFAFEGAAMGFGLRASLRLGTRYEDFEKFIGQLGSEYLYLYYVGLGWWLQMRYQTDLAALWKRIEHLDPRYRPLCLDGYGFKLGFFHYLKRSEILTQALAADPTLAPFIVQGWGRSLRFLYRDDGEGLHRAIETLAQPWRGEAWAGWGLAVAFTQIEDPAAAIASLNQAPAQYLDHVLLGMTFAWTARERCDALLFEGALQRLPLSESEAIKQSTALCQRSLQRAERDAPDSPYATWRDYTRAEVPALWQPLVEAALPRRATDVRL